MYFFFLPMSKLELKGSIRAVGMEESNSERLWFTYTRRY